MTVQTRHVCHRCGGYAPKFVADASGWVCAKHGGAANSESAPISLSTASVSGSSYLCSEQVVPLDVVVDVVTQPVSNGKKQKSAHRASETGSEYFAELERDAKKMGCQPVEVQLPDDLPEAQRVIMEDCAWVAGVYAVHDGEGGEFPYSCRWRTEVVNFGYRTVQRALGALVAGGYLEDHGETDPHRGYPRGTKLYAVGRAPSDRRQRSKRPQVSHNMKRWTSPPWATHSSGFVGCPARSEHRGTQHTVAGIPLMLRRRAAAAHPQ